MQEIKNNPKVFDTLPYDGPFKTISISKTKLVSKKQNKNYFSIDLSKLISCYSVVILHTNGAFWHYTAQHYWKSGNFIECFFSLQFQFFFNVLVQHY